MTGLFYANATRAFSVYYLYENENDEKPQGWGGNDRGGWSEVMLQAIDYKTGKIVWSHKWTGGSSVRSGLLSTAPTSSTPPSSSSLAPAIVCTRSRCGDVRSGHQVRLQPDLNPGHNAC